ncbi:Mu transposase domain-containing protein [Mucilaginibacter rubeus]|uniref:Mu transposase domain-containing protein n=1 Tax=Mucilaginibacter rubeus TaxID=2027860 RepID=UPI001FB60B93|nr:hypothetical protein [Mucilaginibacter rubeus]
MLKGRNYSRKLQFEEIERQTLAPLPVLRYQFKKHFYARVIKNGHVNLGPDKHYYSVPYRFIGKRVKLLYSRTIVEIYSNYERIALHPREKNPMVIRPTKNTWPVPTASKATGRQICSSIGRPPSTRMSGYISFRYWSVNNTPNRLTSPAWEYLALQKAGTTG